MTGPQGIPGRILIGAAIALCGFATWAAWRGPPPRMAPPTPSAIEREPSAQETAAVNEVAEYLSLAIQQTQKRLGRPISLFELEDRDPNGQPHLPYPIPDNPLVPGVSTTATWCGDTPRPNGVDWLYCPETSTFTTGLPQ
jgi:hypothetical protein